MTYASSPLLFGHVITAPRLDSKPSKHRHAAVDVEGVAGDVGGLVGGEVEDGGGDLGALAEAAHGDGGEDRLALLLVEGVGHGRLDHAGRDAVDGDVAARDLGGERLRQADEPSLRGRVVALPRVAGRADDRADVDD